jgi:NADPH:quinone reductase-like Zn-dependent oxidoreductase
MMDAWDFVVSKTDLRQAEVLPAPPPELAEGQARLAVERFALTANNITYAVFGQAMRYWDFFPGPEGFGRVPVWGHARVEASNHPDLAVGQRFYGYWPMSTHLTVTARKTRAGFADVSPHRAELPPVYNQYQLVGAADPAEDFQALLRPLFITGFLIEDLLDENDLFAAKSVVLTSASSKTAIGLAFLLKQRGAARVVGLTSARNKAFVEALGYYDQVVTYDAVASASIDAPVALVDFAGDAPLLKAVHERFGDALAYSGRVGGTHWEAERGGGDLPGPKPVFFFAPDRIRKRAADWGPGGLDERHDAAWAPFAADAPRWLKVVRGVGPEAVAAAYHAVLDGEAGPDEGHILAPLP